MFTKGLYSRFTKLQRKLSFVVLVTFCVTVLSPLPSSLAQTLPAPGSQVSLSASYVPAVIKGLQLSSDNPFRFDFIVDTGDSLLEGDSLKQESSKLIKYFLASLTIPDESMWVNLSPYESDRIIEDDFGKTAMGRDLLAQDYLLKQLTASLLNPDQSLGKKFWDKVHKQVYQEFGTTQVPIDAFHKVWIVPKKAVVYEHEQSAFVTETYLNAMLEEDLSASEEYLVKSEEQDSQKPFTFHPSPFTETMKSIILPAIEEEINKGQTFANLRQIYHSMVLASWFKKKLRNSLLGQTYVNQNKTLGVELEDKDANQKIYDKYVQALQKGVHHLIREEFDQGANQVIPKKYFSGGFHRRPGANEIEVAFDASTAQAALKDNSILSSQHRVSVFLDGVSADASASDLAMLSLKTLVLEDPQRFLDFNRAILSMKHPSLEKVLEQENLHQDMIHYWFDQDSYIGNQPVVIYRINGEFFAARITDKIDTGFVKPILEIDAPGDGKVLQLLTKEDFLKLWASESGMAESIYNTASSPQPFVRAMLSKEIIHKHGRKLLVEEVLGQGWEATVFKVRDVETEEVFALKSSYKDYKGMFEYWKKALEIIRDKAPHTADYFSEYYSYESYGEAGSSLLMDFFPAISWHDFLISLTVEERLKQGVKILAEAIEILREWHKHDIVFGDFSLTNILVGVVGPGKRLLIDPNPEAYLDIEKYRNHDIYQLVQTLFWLVVGGNYMGPDWPQGNYAYRESIISGDFNSETGRKVFGKKPLADDPDYVRLHNLAQEALIGESWDKYNAVLDEIVRFAKTLPDKALLATPGRSVPGSTVTPALVEQEVQKTLSSIGSGIFCPINLLPSYFGERKVGQREFGMGDVQSAKEFILILKKMGQRYYQIFPPNPTDSGNSPYASDSTFAIDTKLVSPQKLVDDGWLKKEDLDQVLPASLTAERVVLSQEEMEYKQKLLDLAYETFKKKKIQESKFETFKKQEAGWLDSYALYKAIEKQNPKRWTQWEQRLKDRNLEALEEFKQSHQDDIERLKFHQYLTQTHWDSLIDFAKEQGIEIIDDIPIYSKHGSVEVWEHRRDVFVLNPDGSRSIVSGALPDYMEDDGQKWNHPVYDWSNPGTLEFWKEKVRRQRKLLPSGLFRQDHFFGLASPLGIPFDGKPIDGKYMQGGGDLLLPALIEEELDLEHSLIVEDVGVGTEKSAELIGKYNLAGMRLFGFVSFNDSLEQARHHYYAPGNFGWQNIFYPGGTHDMALIRAWWEQDLNDTGRANLQAYLTEITGQDQEITSANVAQAVTSMGMHLRTKKIIHRIQDIVRDKSGVTGLVEGRVNTPGTVSADNWTLRLLPEMFTEEMVERMKVLTEESNRTADKTILRLDKRDEYSPEMQLAMTILRRGDSKSKALLEKLRNMLKEGLVRKAPLRKGILSALYEHEDEKTYLLISDHKDHDDYLSTEERAVSIIRALEAIKSEDMSDFLKSRSDKELIRVAKVNAARIEKSLHLVADASTDELREEIIDFMGALLEPTIKLQDMDARIREPIKRMGITDEQRKTFQEELMPLWTTIWRQNEGWGLSREEIILGIIRGTLLKSRKTLRELRWRISQAFDEEITQLRQSQKRRKIVVDKWVNGLENIGDVEKLLFGFDSEPFIHNVDHHGKASGISGLFGMKRKAKRMGKESFSNESNDGHFFYVEKLISSMSDDSLAKEAILKMLARIEIKKENGVVRREAFDSFLLMLETALLKKAKELRDPNSFDASFPAKMDMHIHSYCSDCGVQPISLIIYKAYLKGMKSVALSDHQTFAGVNFAMEVGEIFGVKVTPAIEIYTGIQTEGSIERRRDLLVYFPEVENFQSWFDDGLDEETEAILLEGFNRKIAPELWGNVRINRVVEWSKARGGIPVLAHPGRFYIEDFHKDSFKYETFEEFFMKTGLVGIEISHPGIPLEDTRKYLQLIKRFNAEHPESPLIFLLNTDSHGGEIEVGKQNLTEELFDLISEELELGPFDSKEELADTIRQIIIDSIDKAEERIKKTEALFKLKEAVILQDFSNKDLDRPLVVNKSDEGKKSSSLKAGVKVHNRHPVIIVTNPTKAESWQGKEWGRVTIPGELELDFSDTKEYQFKDLITGKIFTHRGSDLKNGLAVGIRPFSAQLLSMEEIEVDTALFAKMAMNRVRVQPMQHGGINFNPNRFAVEIANEQSDFSSLGVQRNRFEMQFDGFTPIIMNISPLNSLHSVVSPN